MYNGDVARLYSRTHRYVTDEPAIPMPLRLLYVDYRIIVVDKPHFLPTTPRGMWYRSTALQRLRYAFGEPQITPAHRLDRDTAGVVLFVRRPEYRGAYQLLFERHYAHKMYECLAPMQPVHLTAPRVGVVRAIEAPRVFPLLRTSRIVKSRGILQAQEVRGEGNAQTRIELPDDEGPLMYRDPMGRVWRRYQLYPKTGKTHQLRVHMNALGLRIAGDVLYPHIVDRDIADFTYPLQLVARTLRFNDPIDGTPRCYTSTVPLGW